MKTEIKVGCIGCGGRGRLYSSSITKISGFKMWAYADKFADKAGAFLNEYGGDYATTDVEKVLTDPDIDVVFICTHHDTHHPFVVKAAQEGWGRLSTLEIIHFKERFGENLKPLSSTCQQTGASGRYGQPP